MGKKKKKHCYSLLLSYGRSRQATVYLASRTYGHCLTIRTGPREARSHRLHVVERSTTEFLEILYMFTTPLHSSPPDHRALLPALRKNLHRSPER